MYTTELKWLEHNETFWLKHTHQHTNIIHHVLPRLPQANKYHSYNRDRQVCGDLGSTNSKSNHIWVLMSLCIFRICWCHCSCEHKRHNNNELSFSYRVFSLLVRHRITLIAQRFLHKCPSRIFWSRTHDPASSPGEASRTNSIAPARIPFNCSLLLFAVCS